MKKTLKEIRDEAGMTIKGAAEFIGVSHDTIKRWELGITYPTARDIAKIEELYSVRYDQIDFKLPEADEE